MTTALKGNTTEAAVLTSLVRRELAVLIPFGDGHPYDLVVQVCNGQFLRIQCKTARLYKGCVVFNSRSTDHGHGHGTYLGLAELFGVYCPATTRVYLVPVTDVPTTAVYLRLRSARNNQRLKVRFARDYEIDRWTPERLAAITQTGQSTQTDLRLAA